MNDTKLDKISDNIIEIKDEVAAIRIDIAVIQRDLQYHIKRTDLLQEVMDKFKSHLSKLHGIGWFVGFISTALGVAKYLGVI